MNLIHHLLIELKINEGLELLFIINLKSKHILDLFYLFLEDCNELLNEINY
jgi:hypothetical protein